MRWFWTLLPTQRVLAVQAIVQVVLAIQPHSALICLLESKRATRSYFSHNSASVFAKDPIKAVTNNLLWNIVATGASLIPGLGTAVRAGMVGGSPRSVAG